MGQDICCHIIPLIDYLRNQIPLKLSTMFALDLLSDIGLKGDIDCHDLDASDSFFDSIRQK
jgi:hypothetical protein